MTRHPAVRFYEAAPQTPEEVKQATAKALHNKQVQAMLDLGFYPGTERYLDPVSGRLFPLDMQMYADPGRPARRRLKRWRRTGKVKGVAGCSAVVVFTREGVTRRLIRTLGTTWPGACPGTHDSDEQTAACVPCYKRRAYAMLDELKQ